ncbi:DUF4029 domain-containing protein [Bacillus cereus]|uniref:DUF4029 domain-containing protein n=1 Tax=Bacillus TaxID=1386 RepID=UPI000BEBBE94|nr:hypothetical protein CON82_20275 [Bacillus wiedmannii]
MIAIKRILYFVLSEGTFLYLNSLFKIELLPIILGVCMIFSYVKTVREFSFLKIILISLIVGGSSFVSMFILNKIFETITNLHFVIIWDISLKLISICVIIYILELIMKKIFKHCF